MIVAEIDELLAEIRIDLDPNTDSSR